MPVTTDATARRVTPRSRKKAGRASPPSTRSRTASPARGSVLLASLEPTDGAWYVRGRRIRYLDPSLPEDVEPSRGRALARLGRTIGRLARH